MKIIISDRVLLVVISTLVVMAILSTAYIFLIRRHYDFIVEAPCDATVGTCFYRDCSGGDCPSNGLESYRVFSVRAEDFSKCADNSCLQECLNDVIACTETVCGDSQDDECVHELR